MISTSFFLLYNLIDFVVFATEDGLVSLENEINALPSMQLDASWKKVNEILSAISREVDLQEATSKATLWHGYPGIEVIQKHLDAALGDFVGWKTGFFIDNKVREQTEERLILDPGWMNNGYEYCRYYFVNLKEYNRTGLIHYRFKVEEKDVFRRVSGIVTKTITSLTASVDNFINWMIQKTLITTAALGVCYVICRIAGFC